jgi:hypothetical protein
MHPAIMLAGECNVLHVLVLWAWYWLAKIDGPGYRFQESYILNIYATVPQFVGIVLHL